MKKRTENGKYRTVFALVFLLAVLAVPGRVWAAEASVTFGSNYYRATDNEEFPIGVYINGDGGAQIESYQVELTYDTARLSYLGGGDSEEDGVITLFGEGGRQQIKYMLRFQTLSGGDAEVRVKSAAAADAEGEAFDIAELRTAPVYIEGEDTAAEREAEAGENPGDADLDGEPGFSTDIPLAGQTVMGDAAYYIVDASSYLPKQTDWKYKRVTGSYEGKPVTWLTNEAESVYFLYLMDQDEKMTLCACGGGSEQLYPCNTVVMNGTKYYYMSPSVCAEWPEELTLDVVRSEFIVYAMDLSGQAGFYKLGAANELLQWDPGEGRESLYGQTVKLLVILAAALGVIAATVAAAVHFDRAKNRKKRTTNIIEEPEELDFIEDLSLEVTEEEIRSWREEAEENAEKGQPVIIVDNVTMRFRIAMQNVSGIKEYIIQLMKKQISYRELLALDHVSFRVYRGEVVGIIGTNGSGKSTLLKIVSGALSPTSGRVVADRSKVQLLTLGTGFDMELTARENVYLNGAIIGYTKEFLDAHYDEIVAFAELEGFMEEKVRNFSSGMVQRLGFSIATAGDAAEILILDEVLSVGDEFFKKKSLARVMEMIHGGATVLLVSHSASTIVDNCTKAVWIEKGQLRMVGEPKAVCKAYRENGK